MIDDEWSTAATQDVEIAYQAAGAEDGMAIILLHGFPYDYLSYEAVSEAWLNTFPVTCPGRWVWLHFVHARGSDSAEIPVLSLHGCPGSFVQLLDLVPRLTMALA